MSFDAHLVIARGAALATSRRAHTQSELPVEGDVESSNVDLVTLDVLATDRWGNGRGR
jgi:hypothetical protein